MATYIGLDLGGTNIKISVFDDFFHKLGEKRTPTEVRFGSEHVLNRIYDAVLALLDELHLTCQDITAWASVSPASSISKTVFPDFLRIFRNGRRFRSSPGWRAIFISPTYIDNDARVNLYGEWKFGSRQKPQ